jgi:undecaprenyl-diphosphatase
MRLAEGPTPLRHVVALGLLQGPAELLPVSSSGHTTLIPWLAGWPYAKLDGSARKSFELALHAGTAVALAIDMREELQQDAAQLNPRRAAALVLSIAPPALAGLAMRGTVERRLSGPRSIAVGLLAGGVAMVLADARSQQGERGCGDAQPADGLALGVAQALALIPGVSRSGATLTAARARGFDRPASHSLSWLAALPVLLGASLLEAGRLSRGASIDRRTAGLLAVGGTSAFLSTLLSSRILRRGGYRDRALLPYSLYRCLLAALVLGRLRRAR